MSLQGSLSGRAEISREQVLNVLNRVRPYLQSDGGDVELVNIAGNNATVRLAGHCVGCPSAHLTLFFGLETAIREAIPEFGQLLVV